MNDCVREECERERENTYETEQSKSADDDEM